MKEIPLTQGKVALVDDEDFERLNQWKWYAVKDWNVFYAVRHSPMINGKRHTIKMHHEIIGHPSKGFVTDHRNSIGTDNRRKNLRFVTHRQNCQNRKNGKKKSSKYPGVCWSKWAKKWMTTIKINGVTKHLGYFVDEQEAFEIYRNSVRNFGETIIGE